MTILLLNAGSSSLKATLRDTATGTVVARSLADWAGTATRYEQDGPDGERHCEEVPWRGHTEAVRRFAADLPAARRADLAAVGHRVVHGGSFTSSVKITAEIRARLAAQADLAPLHNPPSLETLAAAEAELPGVPHVAVFDTAFHAAMPPEAFTYPVPMRWTQEWGIRRYGFHGLSHAYCARRAAEMLGLRAEQPRVVICHLGHGCSAAAVQGDHCLATTMGFTPLEGLMMATRCGSLDPGVVLHVQQRQDLTVAQVETMLNRESGLLGVSGVSGDMRLVLAAAREGQPQARLALAMYTHRARQAVGALAVTLGGVDALVFTAGVGENSSEIREAICTGLECLGLELERNSNATCRPDADVAVPHSRGRILVLATREDETMFHEVVAVLGSQAPPSNHANS